MAKIEEVSAVGNVSIAEVVKVAEAFRRPGVSFLMPPVGMALTEDTALDISHESLMRVWDKLIIWVEEEAESAEIYRRLSDTATKQAKGKAELYRGIDLGVALKWQKLACPNAVWAKRYDNNFEAATVFLKNSEKKRKEQVEAEEKAQQKAIRLRNLIIGGLVLLLSAMTGIAVFAYLQQQKAIQQERKAFARQLAADGKRLVTGSGAGNNLTGAQLSALSFLEFSKDKRFGKTDFSIELNSALRQSLAKAPLHPLNHDWIVNAVSYSRDGNTLAIASYDNTARVWDAQSGKELARLNHDGWVIAVSYSPDGNTLATASRDGTARVWDAQSGKELARLNHDDRVEAVSYSPDGNTLATASSDNTARVWDAQSGKELARLNHDGWVIARELQPGRQHPRQRQLRQNRPGVGCPIRQRARPPQSR